MKSSCESNVRGSAAAICSSCARSFIRLLMCMAVRVGPAMRAMECSLMVLARRTDERSRRAMRRDGAAAADVAARPADRLISRIMLVRCGGVQFRAVLDGWIWSDCDLLCVASFSCCWLGCARETGWASAAGDSRCHRRAAWVLPGAVQRRAGSDQTTTCSTTQRQHRYNDEHNE